MQAGSNRLVRLALLLLASSFSCSGASAQMLFPNDDLCTTPNNQPGSCINLKSCPALLSLIQQQPLTQSSISFLQKSQCGFEGRDPKVCCENSGFQTTPQPIDDRQVPDVTRHPNLRLLDHNRCGAISSDKIVGGNVTAINEFPWMALIAYRTSSPNPEFRCGGTVINKRYILTAAHCVANLPSNLQLWGARVGEYDLSSERDCNFVGTPQEICAERYQDFTIEEVHYHPEYSTRQYHNDIAIVRVNRDIDFRPANSKPICLPIGTAARITSKKLTVTGWGVSEARVTSPVMLKIRLEEFPHDECTRTYLSKTEIWYKQICMGGQQGRDSCSGDSGGPLQAPALYNNNGRIVQYGIVSFGLRNCGTEGFPGVYTRVDYYLKWILDNMRD